MISDQALSAIAWRNLRQVAHAANLHHSLVVALTDAARQDLKASAPSLVVEVKDQGQNLTSADSGWAHAFGIDPAAPARDDEPT
jgi:hypothetical protein